MILAGFYVLLSTGARVCTLHAKEILIMKKICMLITLHHLLSGLGLPGTVPGVAHTGLLKSSERLKKRKNVRRT